MLTQLKLSNFTCFNDLTMDFSPKINVIIGENGTGKTHLLKVAYFLCKSGALLQDRRREEVREVMTTKLLRLFQPLNQDLGKLWRRGSEGNTQISALFASGEQAAVSFNYNSKNVELIDMAKHLSFSQSPILIPTKEVLSFIKGIHHPDAERATVERIFDDAYLDICDQLVTEPLEDKQERLEYDPRFGSILPNIVKVIGGRYEFNKGDFYFHHGTYSEEVQTINTGNRADKNDESEGHYEDGGVKITDRVKTVFEEEKNTEISNSMTAEGFRKIGLLQQLLLNGTLSPGTSSPLLWDEPEANMNPKLMRFLVEILLEFSRNGQQIILTTHDYILLKWFDLLMDESRDDHIRFFSLYKDGNIIKADMTDYYDSIQPNAIDDAFRALINEELEKAMGGLGR